MTPMYQKECFPSELASSSCSTKKLSFQRSKYSHWSKREFCRHQYVEFHFLNYKLTVYNKRREGTHLFEFSDPKHAINQYLGVS